MPMTSQSSLAAASRGIGQHDAVQHDLSGEAGERPGEQPLPPDRRQRQARAGLQPVLGRQIGRIGAGRFGIAEQPQEEDQVQHQAERALYAARTAAAEPVTGPVTGAVNAAAVRQARRRPAVELKVRVCPLHRRGDDGDQADHEHGGGQ